MPVCREAATYEDSLSPSLTPSQLYSKIVRWQPDLAVQFIGATLASLPTPLSSAPFEVAEAALRLVFHFQEGLSGKMAKMIGSGGLFDQIGEC